MKKTTIRAYTVGAALLSVLGCGDDDSTVDRFWSRARECGVISAGGTPDYGELTDSDECYLECYAAASCEEIRADYCDMGDLEDTCEEACEAILTCDGGSTEYHDYDRCDGYADCDDGADETGCSYFHCGSGEEISTDGKCDGYAECDDGSDEVGCPVFHCGSGEDVSPFYQCDFEEDCEDGSDEAGCAEEILMCE